MTTHQTRIPVKSRAEWSQTHTFKIPSLFYMECNFLVFFFFGRNFQSICRTILYLSKFDVNAVLFFFSFLFRFFFLWKGRRWCVCILPCNAPQAATRERLLYRRCIMPSIAWVWWLCKEPGWESLETLETFEACEKNKLTYGSSRICFCNRDVY